MFHNYTKLLQNFLQFFTFYCSDTFYCSEK